MDGLLLDTEHVYTDVARAIVEPFGKTYTWELKARLMGLQEIDACKLIVSELDLPMTAEEFRAQRNQGHLSRWPLCRPLPGVMRLVSHLKKHGIPIAVATSSFGKVYELKSMNNSDLFSLFDGHIVCGDDERVKRNKPHPDHFQVAARLIGNDLSDPSTCIVFEDSPIGVTAGLAAGMQTIWIPDANLAVDESLRAKCTEVLRSMEDFDPAKYGLPPFDA